MFPWRLSDRTPPHHSGVELRGFLSYFVKVAVRSERYSIFGYKGKQVRNQIHSIDVASAIESFIEYPRVGEVYNIGGGMESNGSILECFEKVEANTGKKIDFVYDEQNRSGDHICYISDLSKLKSHFPEWGLTCFNDDSIEEMLAFEITRLHHSG